MQVLVSSISLVDIDADFRIGPENMLHIRRD